MAQVGCLHAEVAGGLCLSFGSFAPSVWHVGVVSSEREISRICSSVGDSLARTSVLCRVGWRRAMNLGEMKWRDAYLFRTIRLSSLYCRGGKHL